MVFVFNVLHLWTRQLVEVELESEVAVPAMVPETAVVHLCSENYAEKFIVRKATWGWLLCAWGFHVLARWFAFHLPSKDSVGCWGVHSLGRGCWCSGLQESLETPTSGFTWWV